MPNRRPIPAALMSMIEKREDAERRLEKRRTSDFTKEPAPEKPTTTEDSAVSQDVEIDRRSKTNIRRTGNRRGPANRNRSKE